MSSTRVFRKTLRLQHIRCAARQYSQLRSGLKRPSSIQCTASNNLCRVGSQNASLLVPCAVTGIRFQSSQADRSPAVFEQIPNSTPTSSTNATDLFEQLSQTSSSTAPGITPHIGMLKEAGLDFGWGPTAMAEWVVEHLYVTAGLPWWGALVGAALLHRAIFMWPMIRSSHYGAIAQAIAPAQREIRARYKAMEIDAQQGMTMQQQEMRYLAKQTGYKMTSHFGPIVLQGIFSFGLFRLSRNLSLTTDFGLSEGGVLWLQNLTLSDPFYILPAVAGLTLYLAARGNLKRGQASGSMVLSEKHMLTRVMLYGLPAITFVILSQLPAAVQLPMSVLSLTTAATQQALFNNSIRKPLGLALFPTRGAQIIDVTGKRTTVAPPKQEESLSTLMEQFGLPGSGAKKSKSTTKLEQARGKEQVQKAERYDQRRRKKLEEQAMRDRL